MHSAPDDSSSPNPGAEIPDDLQTLIVAKPVAAPQESASYAGANPDSAVPFVFGRRIAKGGMGAILEGDDCKLGRKIAVKVMLDANASVEQTQRFVQEAAVLGRLEHPNIVPIHDLGRDSEGALFYTMKLVKGVTLQHILDDLRHEKKEALAHYTLDRLLTIFRKVCDALAFAHAQNIIHRDLKPENIMVGEFGEVLVMDWGIAKVLDSEVGRAVPSPPREAQEPAHVSAHERSATASDDGAVGTQRPTSLSATMEGAVMGTPNYMSPEQAMGKVNEMDARSDIFSLGGILYCILTLRPPVEGKDVWEVLEKVSSANITAPHQGEGLAKSRPSPARHLASAAPWLVPPALSAVAMKALTLDKMQRYQTIAAFSADIEKYQTGFATSAENAGAMKQLVLLAKRHKGVTASLAAMLLLSVGFVIKVMASEQKATRHAEIAAKNAQEAKQNAETAQANEKRAEDKEREAVAEKENVRRALAESALALAEAAYREANGPAMQAALDRVPSDLREASWSYLLEQSDMSVARLSVRKNAIRAVAAHPKQAGVFAVADDSKTVTILEARTGVRLLQFDVASLKLSTGAYPRLVFSPDGERIAVGKNGPLKNPGGGIAIFSSRDGSKLLEWDSPSVAELEFSPDGTRLLQRIGENQLNLWDAASGKLLWTQTMSGVLCRAHITPDGLQVVNGSDNGQLALRKLEDGMVIKTFGEKPGGLARPIVSLAIHPDGNKVLCGDQNGYVSAFDLRDGHTLYSTRAHVGIVRHVAFTPDGNRFVSAAQLPDGRQSVLVSDAATGAPLQNLIGGSGELPAIAVHPLSGELLVGGPNSRLWDVSGTAAKWVLQVPATGTQSLGSAVFLESDDLFLGPADRLRTALLDLRGAATLWKPANGSFTMASVSADGRIVALGRQGSNSGRIQVLRRQNEDFAPIGEFDASTSFAALRLSPTSDRLALAAKGTERKFSVIEPSTGALLVALERKDLPRIHDFQWVNNGTQLVGLATANANRGVAKSEERIVVWDAASGQQVRSVVHPTALDCLVVAPDGKSFAAAGADKLVHVFDTETLAERQAFRAHDGPVTALAWHPARPIVATASEDLTIKLWNLDTGRRLETLRGPTDTPRVLNFSPSGQRLACASLDRAVRIWEPPSLNNATLDAPKTDGWEDLFAKLKADDVKANGNGWTLSGGVLMSPEKRVASLPLPGNYARTSYQVHVTLRRLKPENALRVILPVADQQTHFVLDAVAKGEVFEGIVTGLEAVDDKSGWLLPNTVHGQQIKDTEPHELEISVQLSARTARITATLDERPLYEWSGPVASLSLGKNWPALPQPNLFLGTSSADWVVSAVKVKRLEK